MLNLQEQTTITTLENALDTLMSQGCSKNRDCSICTRSIHTEKGYYCGAGKMISILKMIKENIEEEN